MFTLWNACILVWVSVYWCGFLQKGLSSDAPGLCQRTENLYPLCLFSENEYIFARLIVTLQIQSSSAVHELNNHPQQSSLQMIKTQLACVANSEIPCGCHPHLDNTHTGGVYVSFPLLLLFLQDNCSHMEICFYSLFYHLSETKLRLDSKFLFVVSNEYCSLIFNFIFGG